MGSKSWCEHFEEEDDLLPLLGIETQIIQVIASSLYCYSMLAALINSCISFNWKFNLKLNFIFKYDML
jgi:hypothetical protein